MLNRLLVYIRQLDQISFRLLCTGGGCIERIEIIMTNIKHYTFNLH